MRFLVVFILIFFLGCSEKNFIYINTNQKAVKKVDKTIGIDQVSVPLYMSDLEIMKLENSKLARTGVYLSKDIKNIFITTISNLLNDPYVYSYPFGMDKKPKYRIKIKIDDFYLKDDKIILNARFFINNYFKKISLSKKCFKNYKCINEILNEFAKNIIKEIK